MCVCAITERRIHEAEIEVEFHAVFNFSKKKRPSLQNKRPIKGQHREENI